MSDQFEHKKKKDKKNKQVLDSENLENPENPANPYLTGQEENRKKIEALEEQVKILESRFRLLEDLVPQELRNLSEQVTNLGKFVGYDKGERS
ncbi:MAG: hypothetical protein HQL69_24475 [Magnetococcales bacterium]|nr:hypothetical protein [Magnetococcales bacterium]